MLDHYHAVARQLGIDHADTLDFGSSDVVDEAYKNQPADIPIIRFVKTLLEAFPDREVIINVDQDFDNRFRCDEVVGNNDQILKALWLTTAYGYQWPNLRLKITKS